MRYTKEVYTNIESGELVCEPLAGDKAILINECDGSYKPPQDGKCKECDYRTEAYQRVRRNDTRFTIGCDKKTKFMKRKKVDGCPKCLNDNCVDNCDNCDNKPERNPVQCRTGCVSKQQVKKSTQKRIDKTVMLSSSEYLMKKAALNVSKDTQNKSSSSKRNSQASDRKEAAKKTSDVKTRNYSSTHRTRLSLKPGALAPGGTGVDVKHNSYARYLAKKKGHLAQGLTDSCVC